MNQVLEKINDLVASQTSVVDTILNETSQVIVGQKLLLERLLIGVLTGGHILLEGVPGLAKTLSIKTLAAVVDASFKRIQFTPDLLPSDVVGTLIYDQAKQDFIPSLGPIFAHFVLADEINRAPAKVQSALLEVMQEKQVTIGKETYPLEEPFLVLATQNPVDQEGTYALPEAQVDRFLMKVILDYPSREDEKGIIDRMSGHALPSVKALVKPEQLLQAREVVSQIYVDDKIKEYCLDLVLATRYPEKYQLESLSGLIQFGCSPRASLSLIQAAKGHAFIKKRGYVTPEDIKAIGKDVMRHRIITSFEAEAEEMTSDLILDKIFSEIEVP